MASVCRECKGCIGAMLHSEGRVAISWANRFILIFAGVPLWKYVVSSLFVEFLPVSGPYLRGGGICPSFVRGNVAVDLPSRS